MRRAKAVGPGSDQWFVEAMRSEVHQRAATERALARAIDEGQFRLMYQPKIALDDRRMVGVEALLRWMDPAGIMVPPLEFIPLAEESGLIIPIGGWVVEEGCLQAARWARAFPEREPLVMCINVSVRQFGPSLVETVRLAIERSGVAPTSIVLEVTETALMADTDLTMATLDALKSLGVQLAIDDFGTGYSSLAYLTRFPVDDIKVDREFVAGLGSRRQDSAVVAAVAHIAREMGLNMIAEGIETEDQLGRLKALGCPFGQGYLLGRPMWPDAIEELLRAAPPAPAFSS